MPAMFPIAAGTAWRITGRRRHAPRTFRKRFRRYEVLVLEIEETRLEWFYYYPGGGQTPPKDAETTTRWRLARVQELLPIEAAS